MLKSGACDALRMEVRIHSNFAANANSVASAGKFNSS